MCTRLEDNLAALGSVVEALDVSRLSGAQATALHELFARAERLAVAGRTLCSAAIDRTGAFRDAGHHGAAQAAAVALGAWADPGAEQSLLKAAATNSVKELRQKALMVRAAAPGGEDLLEAIRATRYLKMWDEKDGALRLQGRLPPEHGGKVRAVLQILTMGDEVEAREELPSPRLAWR